MLRPRSAGDPSDRRAHAGPEEEVYDRDRHPQFAAGEAGGGHNRVSLCRYLERRAYGLSRRVWPDARDLRRAEGTVHQGIRPWRVQLSRLPGKDADLISSRRLSSTCETHAGARAPDLELVGWGPL